MLPIIRT
jgi:putative SOS response-associated peptidase YedK